MQYFFLKNIISSILANFHCQDCKTKATENSLNIQKISNKWVDIVFVCPQCSAKAMMRAEMWQLTKDFLSSDVGQNFLKEAMVDRAMIIPNFIKPDSISLDEIHKIEEKLSKNPTINDFINGE